MAARQAKIRAGTNYRCAPGPLTIIFRMVTPPKLTDEQRKAALAKASAARRARADLKAELRLGTKTLKDVIALADSDAVVGGTKVLAVLESLQGTGKVKARKAMEELKIAEGRKISGLGSKQRASLLKYFSG